MNTFKKVFQRILPGLAISAVLAIALLLRISFWGSVPPALYIDEVAMLAETQAILTHGTDIHGNSWWQAIFPSWGDYKLPVYIWLATIASWLVGVGETGVRLPSLLAGLLTVIMAGAIGVRLLTQTDPNAKSSKNQYRSFLFVSICLVVALSPWSVLFSRAAFEGHVAQFLVASSVWFLLSPKLSWRELGLAILLGSVATYTYFSVRFVWPVLFAVIIMIGRRWSIKWLVLPLLIYALTLWPMLASPHYQDSQQLRYSTASLLDAEDRVLATNFYREQTGDTWWSRALFHRHFFFAKDVLGHYAQHFSPSYLFLTGDANLRHGTGQHGLFLLPMAPFLILGFYRLFWGGRFRAGLVLMVWWLIALLPAAVPMEVPHALRSLNALVPISIIIGLGLSEFLMGMWHSKWFLWAGKSRYMVKGLLSLGLGMWLILATLEFGMFYFKIFAGQASSFWEVGKKELAQEVEMLDQEQEVYLAGVDDKFFVWRLAYGQANQLAELKELPIYSRGQLPEFFEEGAFLVIPDSWLDYQAPESLALDSGASWWAQSQINVASGDRNVLYSIVWVEPGATVRYVK